MKRALITGITGQDGAYLAALLLANGYQVVGGSRRTASPSYWRLEELGLMRDGLEIDNFRLINLDITCSSQVATVVGDGQYDEIYNLAAQSFVPESFASPVATAQINYVGVLNLLDSIKRLSPKSRFYQASTSEMFGLTNTDGQNEETPFHPRSPYAVAKAAAHYATQNYREAHGLHASSGILFNHESPLRGSEFVTRKVSQAVARITVEKQEKVLMGNLDSRRDWGFADDYVRGMWLMLQQDEPDDYVLATGEAHSIREMLAVAFEHAGMDYEKYVEQDARYMRPSDVPLLCGDASKARDKLGWRPVFGFQDIITQMVDADLYREGVDPVQLHAEVDALFNLSQSL